MAKAVKFYFCKHCKKIIGIINDPGVPTICCGEAMVELKANVSDGATEKHVPVVKANGNTISVTIGSVDHPMAEDHYIEWIYVQTENGGQRKILKPGEKPFAEFAFVNDKAVAVYEYCNKHGLWKVDL